MAKMKERDRVAFITKNKIKKVNLVIKAEDWKKDGDEQQDEDEKSKEEDPRNKKITTSGWKEEEKNMRLKEKANDPNVKRFSLPAKKKIETIDDPHMKGRSPI